MTDRAFVIRRQFLSGLRKVCDQRRMPRMAVVELRPDWMKGHLASAAIVLALVVVEANHAADALLEETRRARAAVEQERTARLAQDAATQIRLEGEGFACRNFKIRREWVAVVTSECERLAAILRVARANE